MRAHGHRPSKRYTYVSDNFMERNWEYFAGLQDDDLQDGFKITMTNEDQLPMHIMEDAIMEGGQGEDFQEENFDPYFGQGNMATQQEEENSDDEHGMQEGQRPQIPNGVPNGVQHSMLQVQEQEQQLGEEIWELAVQRWRHRTYGSQRGEQRLQPNGKVRPSDPDKVNFNEGFSMLQEGERQGDDCWDRAVLQWRSKYQAELHENQRKEDWEISSAFFSDMMQQKHGATTGAKEESEPIPMELDLSSTKTSGEQETVQGKEVKKRKSRELEERAGGEEQGMCRPPKKRKGQLVQEEEEVKDIPPMGSGAEEIAQNWSQSGGFRAAEPNQLHRES